MDSPFQELIRRIIAEQGIFVFEQWEQCRGLLYDYAKGRYKREIRLFLYALAGGCYQELRDTGPGEPERLVQRLQADYGITPGEAQEALDLALQVLEETGEDPELAQEIDRLEKSARKGNYRAMYELGLLLEKLTWYEESHYWFKQAAKQGLILYERSLQEPKEIKPVPEADPGVPKNFVRIPGGTFMMGSPITDPGWSVQETQHQVKVSSYGMGIYTVTQEEYQDIMGTNPSRFKGADLPVENVSWFEAAAYCNARSLREKRTPAYMIHREYVTWNRNTTGYRLPTEAEWEYACRAGTRDSFYTGMRITTDQANYNGTILYKHNLPGIFRQKTTGVGTFPPNPWGLYDMHGNVYEWCWDWYGDYRIGSQRDPGGPVSGEKRVIRGGSWNYSARSLRSACRNSDSPGRRGSSIGFRLLFPLKESE